MRANKTKYTYSLNQLYGAVGISKQAVHQHHKRLEAQEANIGLLLPEIDLIRERHPGCGIEKMYHMLKPSWIGRDNFIELLMGLGYRVQKQKNYSRTTYSIKSHYHPNLIEGLELTDINQVVQTDITYYWIGGKFCYITFLIDVYSRRITGCYASGNLRAQANIKALKMLLKVRKGFDLSRLIHHSDRGAQYIDKDYIKLLNENEMTPSMGLKATENAYSERINGTIKNEYLKYKDINNLEQLRKELKKAVDHYNNKRPHNNLLKRMPPCVFEKECINLGRMEKPKLKIYKEK